MLHRPVSAVTAIVLLWTVVAAVAALQRDASSPSLSEAQKEQIIVYKLDGVYSKLLQCTGEYEFIHCLQLFMVQRIERMKNQFGKSGDIKRDFLDKLFKVDMNATTAEDFVIRPENHNLTESQLSTKLMELSKEYYFQNTRRARLEIIPGYSLDIKFPAEDELITFALVRHATTDVAVASQRQARRRKKHDLDDEELLKMGLPLSVVPFVGIAAIFPFIYPWLKMGAIFSLIVNKIALVAAWIHMMKNHGSLFDRTSLPIFAGGR